MDEDDCVKFLTGCWAMWEFRNKVVFDNVVVEPELIVRRTKDVIAEGVGDWGEGTIGTRAVQRRRGRNIGEEQGWKPAKEGHVKLNVDAGVKEGEGVGTGAVCRDSSGLVLWGLSVYRLQEWEVHYAEAMAILDGLEEAVNRGITKIEVESDCLPVVNAIRERRTGRSAFALVIDDIIELSLRFDSFYCSHVSRSNNCVAHELAHLVPRTIGKVIWDAGLPPSANAAVIFDRNAIE
ncbi:uncharacterized protein LOC141600194 [Silene latifolia]|uniref:uncharacterized protein LOC141600194 n=1 Tax=Silene latifolia TaxID=37657 RepID=UPI003D77C5C8